MQVAQSLLVHANLELAQMIEIVAEVTHALDDAVKLALIGALLPASRRKTEAVETDRAQASLRVALVL